MRYWSISVLKVSLYLEDEDNKGRQERKRLSENKKDKEKP